MNYINRSVFLSLFAAAYIGTGVQAQSTVTLARGLTAAVGAQGRLIWIDGTANIFRSHKQNGNVTYTDYTTTREGVAKIVAQCKAAHINTLVVDVKPLAGQVLYASKLAPHMTEWQKKPVRDSDVLAAFIEEGHKAGLQVDASVNVLSEGHKYYSVGPAYQHTDWQSVVYTVDRGLMAPNGARLNVRVSGEPADPDAPQLLRDDTALLASEPVSGMVGLESTDAGKGGADASIALGKQTNLILDSSNKVTGVVDSALLGDDPLTAPESGHMVTASRLTDRDWISKNVHVGDRLRLDLRTDRKLIADAPSEKIACFVNPLHPDARKYEMDMIREIVTNYNIDGIVLDRCRYSNLYNDFSDRTRDAFVRWLEQHQAHASSRRQHDKLNRFPEDIFAFAQTPGDPIIKGPLFKPWLEFRAQTIHDFVADVAQIVHSIKPGIAMGTYVGSWYPKYYEVGVNWGSSRTPLRFSWFTSDYPQTGYAEYFDWICTGCYYKTATKEDARADGQSEYGTVEYAAELSNTAVASGAFVYGGIYVLDYPGKPGVFAKALDAAARQTQGWMVFDISQVDDYNYWPVIEKAFPTPTVPPGAVPDLLQSIRSARQ